jgi:hypothetical protein
VAYVGQTRSVTLNFRTSDGTAATQLRLSLPAAPGWQAQNGQLSCATVVGEGSCVLRLNYAPAQTSASATLRLPYTYVDSAGINQSGSVAITYRALAANAAVVSASPNPVSGIVGQTSAVTLNFDTNDGSTATVLSVVQALPTGWSSDVADFRCPSFGGGAGCQLVLRYTPTQATSQSSFRVNYSYVDSAGKAQSDAISLGYAAVGPNEAMVKVEGNDPSSPGFIVGEPNFPQDVAITFTSSDGNALSNLKLAADTILPAGWTADVDVPSFSCATVSQDGACQLILHYKPDTVQPRNTLSLNFSYLNAAQQALSGVVKLDYSSTVYRLYVADNGVGAPGFKQCWLEASGSGSLAGCDDPDQASRFPLTKRIVINGTVAYLLSPSESLIRLCSVDADGTVANCAGKIDAIPEPAQLAVIGNSAYILDENGTTLWACPASGDGACGRVKISIPSVKLGDAFRAMTSDGTSLYLLDNAVLQVVRCTPGQFDSLDWTCTSLPTGTTRFFTQMTAVTVADSTSVYLGFNEGQAGPVFYRCSFTENQCAQTKTPNTFPSGDNNTPLSLVDMKGSGANLYFLVRGFFTVSGVVQCSVDKVGNLGTCGGLTRIPAMGGNLLTSIELR